MTCVLVAGSSGLLGSSLVPFLIKKEYKTVTVGRSSSNDLIADFTDYDSTISTLNSVQPNIIINLIANTDVDRCESHPHEAYVANVQPVLNIVSWILGSCASSHLVHISTDQVYNSVGPHDEQQIKICNHYGMTKIASEIAATGVSHTILRTNFIGRSLSPKRKSLTDWLFSSLLSQTPINVFDDVYFSPLSINMLCCLIDKVISSRCQGTFNLGSNHGLSKADLAFVFADALGLSDTCLHRSNFQSSHLSAPRPHDMRMNSGLFERNFGLVLPSLTDEIFCLAKTYRTIL